MRGTVAWFNNARGYGFIQPDGGGERIFVHFTAILRDGFKDLREGESVEFDVAHDSRGGHACNVKPLEGK